MDQDLVAFLNQHFASMELRMEERFQETGEQIRTLREEFRQETLQRFERVDQRFDRAEDDVHGVHIVLEDLQGTVRLVAEGVTSVREELAQKTEELSQGPEGPG